MAEASPGKDSVTGHWEIAGLILDRPFPTFPHGFAPGMMREFERRVGRATIGNVPASGTAIIDELGPEHLRTGALHRLHVGRQRVSYRRPRGRRAHRRAVQHLPCGLRNVRDRSWRRPRDRAAVHRVPGRFGEPPTAAIRVDPPAPTLLDRLSAAGHEVVGLGKIEDLFAGRGLSVPRTRPATITAWACSNRGDRADGRAA